LYAFLRHLGATLIVSLAIPISILATFTLMYFQNLTLNIMTLGGLALGAGMLVDNAIVVIENTFRRRQLGEEASKASVTGASEVGVAIVASTLTTIIVFLPIVYVRGIAAELFREQAWVVAFSLLSSLFIAFTLIPTLSARLFANKLPEFQQKVIRLPFYEKFLDWALKHRVRVIAIAFFLLVVSILLIPVVGSEFVPRSSENQVQVQVEMPAGTPLQRTTRVINAIEERVRQLFGPDIDYVYSTVNVQASQNVLFGAGQRSEHRAEIVLGLAKGKDVLAPSAAIEILRSRVEVPGTIIHYTVRESSLQQTIGSEKAPVTIEVRGDDLTILRNTTNQLAQLLQEIEGLHTIETSFERGLPEINLRVNRTLAASFGLDIQQIGQMVQQRLSGEVASDFFAEGNDRDIRVAFEQMSQTDLENMQIQTSDGALLKLTDLVTLVPNEGPQEIQRRNQSRIAHVAAQMKQDLKASSAGGSVE
jgi:HAE1 family hydrophobic/amphiphilic exporter-1